MRRRVRGGEAFSTPVALRGVGCTVRGQRGGGGGTCCALRRSSMNLLNAAHTAPEFLTHVAASCGAAMFGVLGAKATKVPRALMAARSAEERRKRAEERVIREARRKELASAAELLGEKANWNDVDVDAIENRKIEVGETLDRALPMSQFQSFDRLLSRASTVAAPMGSGAGGPPTPPAASEFLTDDDDVLLT